MVLSGITFLYYLATVEIAQYLGGNRVQLLLAIREKGALNFLFEAALNNMAQGLCLFDSQQRLPIANRRFSEIFKISSNKLPSATPIREVMALAQATDKNPGRRRRCATQNCSPNYQPVQSAPLWPMGTLSRSRIDQCPMAASWPLLTM